VSSRIAPVDLGFGLHRARPWEDDDAGPSIATWLNGPARPIQFWPPVLLMAGARLCEMGWPGEVQPGFGQIWPVRIFLKKIPLLIS
jgi:hypothetical protein